MPNNLSYNFILNHAKPPKKRMGVVLKRGSYWLDYRFNGRRIRQKVGPHKYQAEIAWSKVQTQIYENRFLDVRREKRVKLEDFAEEYYTVYCIPNHTTPEKAVRFRLNVLKKYFAGKFLHEIHPTLIEQFKSERLKEANPATVNRDLACLKALFNKAIQWEKFDGKNPVNKIRPLKENNHMVRFLSKEEIERLISCSRHIIQPLVTLAIFTGMRRGELFNLKWSDIDFSNDLIHLLKTKSGKKREIPMNEQVKNALIGVRKHPQSPYVFGRSKGEPLKDVRRGFDAALRRANIKNCRFHDLRHTFASQLVMNGTDLVTVKDLMGHSDIKTTLIYSHLSKSHKKRAVDSLGMIMDTHRTLTPQVHPQVEQLVSTNI